LTANKYTDGGPGWIGDLARKSGTMTLTNQQIADAGRSAESISPGVVIA